MKTVKVRVPATSANLGPGFDCLGLALGIHNSIQATPADAGTLVIKVEGEGIGQIPTDDRNLVWRAFSAVYETARQRTPGLEITQHNRIPVNSGLGSSASAVAAGLVLANEFLHGRFGKEELMEIGMHIEGHVDNLAAAIMGGLTLACVDEGKVYCRKYPANKDFRAVICVPKLKVNTAESRRRLPSVVLLGDAVYNMGHALLLLAGLVEGQATTVRVGMRDRLHQEQRMKSIPGATEALEAALEAGADGACLSGSGPTILALAKDAFDRISRAMEEGFGEAGVEAEATVVDLEEEGAGTVG